MKSAIFTGTIHHRRLKPKAHDFHYDVAMFYIDLSEVEKVFNVPFLFSHFFPRLIGFNRRHYLKGDESLALTVKKLVLKKTGKSVSGAIRMLTQISYFGFCFNPVTFYYCFDEYEELQFIVSEITNTPWNERHVYVLECHPREPKNHFEFKKDFHVSPFLPMDLQYVWDFTTPDLMGKDPYIKVRMEDWDLQFKERVFNAVLSLHGKPVTSWNLLKTVLGYPLLTLKTFLAIYYQAVILKLLKKASFYRHPKSGGKVS